MGSDAMPELSVLWCDFGGVLTPPLDQAIASIVEASGVPWAELRRAADAVAAELGLRGLQPLELGILSQADWGARVTALLPTAPRVDLGRWGDHWYRDRPMNAELLAELERVASAGVRVGMLTNSVLEWEPHRERMLAGTTVFDAVVRSHELGLAKPDARIFVHADGVLPPNGGGVALIDDVAANCAAAAAHGWLGILHERTADTVDRLRRLVP
jgi:putative hydrolase of the HAD superfamily